MKLLYLTITLFIFSNSLRAEEVGYEVEVIIFEDSTSTYEHSEIWQDKDANAVAIDPVVTINNDNSGNNTSNRPTVTTKTGKEKYTFISNDKLRLNNQENKLNTHADYKVLYHRAWKQAGLDKDQAFPVHIDSRNLLGTEASNTVSTETSNSNANYIDGSITLIMSRYLHVNTNLVYHRSAKNENSISIDKTSTSDAIGSFSEYNINFERRMRSREIHYLDHPLVGIIVLATPYKIETKLDSPVQTYKSL